MVVLHNMVYTYLGICQEYVIACCIVLQFLPMTLCYLLFSVRLAEERDRILQHMECVTPATFETPGRFGDVQHDAPSARRGWFITLATKVCRSFL